MEIFFSGHALGFLDACEVAVDFRERGGFGHRQFAAGAGAQGEQDVMGVDAVEWARRSVGRLHTADFRDEVRGGERAENLLREAARHAEFSGELDDAGGF